uniref:Uncharacterized protein n=1 Tax=Eucampia antarctica TaxID=49252 RepID=A0A7S2RDF1_9STRA|mmetsp:Transcript_20140/g.19385  ORF Transcript_20140/g.19385 Transcript_20140/m.19385 type:complete len:345 (+) Transcript_20140:76-1110(+)
MMKLQQHCNKLRFVWIITIATFVTFLVVGVHASSSSRSLGHGNKYASSASKSSNSMVVGTNNKNNRRKSVSIRRSSSSCRFFLWDGISAVKYYTCERLMRERVYEGLGGKKFVRIRPGSILDSLYPLSNHSPDRCSSCGQSFHQHLATWWFPRLYSSYDLYLDKVFQRATTTIYNHPVPPSSPKKITSKKQKHHPPLSSSNDDNDDNYKQEEKEPDMKPFLNGFRKPNYFPTLNYHKAYVRLLGEEDETIIPEEQQRLKGTSTRKRKQSNEKVETTMKGQNKYYGTRTSLDGIQYKVQKLQIQKKKDVRVGAFFIHALSRAIVLQELETFLWLEQEENWKNEGK